RVCQTQCEAGLDLFSSSRQNNDVLTWFTKLTQLVLAQDRDPSWFDFMCHLLGLNHLVVEKSWDVVLRQSLTDSPQNSVETLAAQDRFLCEIVGMYVKMRRTSDLLSALMDACLSSTGCGRIHSIRETAKFNNRLCEMFSEVPISTLLGMWEKVQTKTTLLVDRAMVLSSSALKSSKKDTIELLSQLDWILGLYSVLLGNARLFDHRNSGAFSARIAALVKAAGDELLAPLYKNKE
ncbi:hypothetical protein EGW08_017231, partial [Elysia chlorotica]